MQQAQKTNIPQIKFLLEENGLPIADIETNIDFYIGIENNHIVVTGGLEPAGEDVIMRSIAVAENFKGKGFGAKMTRYLIGIAKKNKSNTVFLLTMTAENYFPKFGFIAVKRESAPEPIKNSSEFTTVCPDSAILMKLEIN